MADDINKEEPSAVSAAASTTIGAGKGTITGAIVGGAISAVIGAAIGTVAGPVFNYFKGAELTTGVTPADTSAALNSAADQLPDFVNGGSQLINGALGTNLPANMGPVNAATRAAVDASNIVATPSVGISLGDATLKGAGIGGAVGAAFGAITGSIGGIASAISGLFVRKDELANEQAKQMEFAKGVAQGVTMAKLEDMEQAAVSTAWQEKVGGPKAAPEQYAQMVREQQAQVALAAMEPQGRA